MDQWYQRRRRNGNYRSKECISTKTTTPDLHCWFRNSCNDIFINRFSFRLWMKIEFWSLLHETNELLTAAHSGHWYPSILSLSPRFLTTALYLYLMPLLMPLLMSSFLLFSKLQNERSCFNLKDTIHKRSSTFSLVLLRYWISYILNFYAFEYYLIYIFISDWY